MPVPGPVRACFKRAAEARIAFIRGYGLAAPDATTPRVGPGFDSAKALRPLALMICADAGLSRVDLRYNETYWALLQQLDPSARKGLRQEEEAFIDAVQDQCRMPRSGGLTTQLWQARDCVRDAYKGQRNGWLSRLSGPAYEERRARLFGTGRQPPERPGHRDRRSREQIPIAVSELADQYLMRRVTRASSSWAVSGGSSDRRPTTRLVCRVRQLLG
jgi:uncharacterized protein YecT (DUF1311 family)